MIMLSPGEQPPYRCLSLLHFPLELLVCTCLFVSKCKAHDSTHSNFTERETPRGLTAAAGRRREHFCASFRHNSRALCCSQMTWSFLFLFSPSVVHIQPWYCAEAVLALCHYTSTPSSENHPTAVLRFVQPFNCLVLICLDACCCHRNTITRSILWSVIYVWHIRTTYNYCFLCCPLLNSTQLFPTSHITSYLWLLIRFWGGF